MINTGKHLSRRTMLGGLGVAIGPPVLDAMAPAFAAPAARRAGKAPLRLAFTYIPNGVTMKNGNRLPPARTLSSRAF